MKLREQLKRSSAADFGLRGDVPYLEAVIAAVNDGNQPGGEGAQDRRDPLEPRPRSFPLSIISTSTRCSAYLVKVNIVARWTRLDDKQGREMLHRLMTSLDGKDLINKQ